MSTYVLLPGAGGEAWYWHLVTPRLQAAGHEAIAVDLPAEDESAGLDAYSDVVVEAIGGRSDVTLVAQSMGALCAPLACERSAERVTSLVLVCPMIPALGESGGAWWAASGQEEAQREYDRREGRDPDAPFDPMTLFFHDVADEVVAAAYARGEPRQSERPFADPYPLDRWPGVPTRVIAGRHDRLFPLPFMRKLARERLGVEAEVIDSGHLPALATPDRLAAMLLE